MNNPISVQKIHTYDGHKESLYALAGHTETTFFSAGSDGMIILWDLHNLSSGQLIAKVPNSVYALHYEADTDHLIIGQNFDGIHVIDVSAGKEVFSLQLTEKEIFDIQSDDEYLYLATGEGEIIWIRKSDYSIANRGAYSSMRARCVEPIGDQLAVGFSDNHIRLIGKRSGDVLADREAHKISVFTVRYDQANDRILSGSRDAHLKAWDTVSLQEKEDVVAHMYAINHIEFSPDGGHFVTCSMDKSIKIWDSSSFKLRKVIDKARHAGHGTSVNKLLWMKKNDFLVSCSDDRTISVWDINFGK